MTDFFGRLSARTLGAGAIASPRLLGPYEAAANFAESGVDPQAREKSPDAETPRPAARMIDAVPRPAIVGSEEPAVSMRPGLTLNGLHARDAALQAVVERRAPAVHEAGPARAADTAEVSDGSVVRPITSPAPFSRRPNGNDRPPTLPFPPPPLEPARSASSRSRTEIVDRPARPLSRNSARQDDADQTPTIQVTIGRVEVRALTPPTQARPAPPRSMLRSLDDYLKPQPRN